MRKLLAAWMDTITADLRQLVSAREAASVDAFNVQLRAVTTTEEERADIRRSAILLAQLGIRADDVEPMATQWITNPHRTYIELMTASRRIAEQAKVYEPKGTR